MTDKEFDYPIMFKTYTCHACKEQFVVACSDQLQTKLKNHKCPNRVRNKKRERSEQLERNRIALCVHDMVVNNIEQYNFNSLIRQGIIISA